MASIVCRSGHAKTVTHTPKNLLAVLCQDFLTHIPTRPSRLVLLVYLRSFASCKVACKWQKCKCRREVLPFRTACGITLLADSSHRTSHAEHFSETSWKPKLRSVFQKGDLRKKTRTLHCVSFVNVINVCLAHTNLAWAHSFMLSVRALTVSLLVCLALSLLAVVSCDTNFGRRSQACGQHHLLQLCQCLRQSFPVVPCTGALCAECGTNGDVLRSSLCYSCSSRLPMSLSERLHRTASRSMRPSVPVIGEVVGQLPCSFWRKPILSTRAYMYPAYRTYMSISLSICF